MKKVFIVASGFAIAVSGAIVACDSSSTPSSRNEGMTIVAGVRSDSLVQRGEYLVTIMGCQDCHTPKTMGKFGPEPDPLRAFSGHPANEPLPKIDVTELKSWALFNHSTTAMVGPWGVSFVANISSDETGIGNWSEQQFFKAIREGKYKGLDNSRPLLPPMPWPMYAKATDQDPRAIFAYLKSTKPVRNVVPAPIPPDRLAQLK